MVSICVWCTPYCSLISLATSVPQSTPTTGPDSTTGLTSSPTAQPSAVSDTPTSCQQSQLIMIALAATTVLLLLLLVVVLVGLVVIMVTVVRRRRSKEHVYENNNTDRSVRVQMRSNSLQSTTYYEPISLNIGPSHLHHQPHTLRIPLISTQNIGDDITMEDCPAYQSASMEMNTSEEHTYI